LGEDGPVAGMGLREGMMGDCLGPGRGTPVLRGERRVEKVCKTEGERVRESNAKLGRRMLN
jgi:hypothetical protein